ncbi:MAG TPA: branched-chain amino acid transaminase [Vicinamibacterales bacterium]|nr:branched-chain amino acid transaminase [Vicinamibacterales bacterium]
MAPFTKSDTIWFNGAFVPWDAARVHVMAHGLHYGTGVFEGIRSYETDDGPAVFRLDDHIARLFASAALYELEIPYTAAELTSATLELLTRNRLTRTYIRPIAFFDAHSLTLWPRECPVSVAIAAMPLGAYLGEGITKGVRVCISSVRRFDASAIPTTAKACGQYVNSVRAVQEALRRGFDEAIFLNQRGEVAEGSGENLFLVKDGAILTNGEEAGVLPGITRASVLEIAATLGIPARVAPISVADLSAADELFFTGTAAEVTPIVDVDGRAVSGGTPGPITLRLQESFFDVVHGRDPRFTRWLAYADALASS